MTGFEPAISWFVVRRVIRCATRSWLLQLQFLPYLNLVFATFCPNHAWPFVCPLTTSWVLKLGGWNFASDLCSSRVDSWGRLGRPPRPPRPLRPHQTSSFRDISNYNGQEVSNLLHLPINRTKIANFDNKKLKKS